MSLEVKTLFCVNNSNNDAIVILSRGIISKTHPEFNVLDYAFAKSQLVRSILVDTGGIRDLRK